MEPPLVRLPPLAGGGSSYTRDRQGHRAHGTVYQKRLQATWGRNSALFLPWSVVRLSVCSIISKERRVSYPQKVLRKGWRDVPPNPSVPRRIVPGVPPAGLGEIPSPTRAPIAVRAFAGGPEEFSLGSREFLPSCICICRYTRTQEYGFHAFRYAVGQRSWPPTRPCLLMRGLEYPPSGRQNY